MDVAHQDAPARTPDLATFEVETGQTSCTMTSHMQPRGPERTSVMTPTLAETCTGIAKHPTGDDGSGDST